MFLIIFLIFVTQEILCLNTNETDVRFHTGNPSVIDMDTTEDIRLDFICNGYNYCNKISLNFTSTVENTNIMEIVGNNTLFYSKDDYEVFNATLEELYIANVTVRIRGEFLGKTQLEVKLLDKEERRWAHKINVRRVRSPWDLLFQGCFFFMDIGTFLSQ